MGENRTEEQEDQVDKKLRAFKMHGVNVHSLVGNQALADCVFCGKEKHFYINHENLLWDCKVCGEKGNFVSFLDKINHRNLSQMTSGSLKALAENRKLPKEAFDGLEIGFNDGKYTLAVRNQAGKLQDIRLYQLGGKMISTAQAKTGIFGLKDLLRKSDELVYICEGEWDTIAMRWMLKKSGQKGVAVCSPGANVFKAEWADFFARRRVLVCYDNDDAGTKGMKTVHSRLKSLAADIKFIHWPEQKAPGYDLRDFVVDKVVKGKIPKKAFRIFTSYMRNALREEGPVIGEIEGGDERKAPTIDPSITIEDVFSAYDAKLWRPNKFAIELCLISVISNMFDTKPLWYFLVAPSSSGKTAVIEGFRYLWTPYDDLAYMSSKLSAHSLISGMKATRDPSMLAIFENKPKTLFIKDFTTIMSAPDNEKQEVYGHMRDAYDGYSSKDFGNGVIRRYDNLNFAVIAGVTPVIYDESSSFQALGERFGKLIVSLETSLENVRQMMKKTRDNIGREKELDENICSVIYSFIKNTIARIEENGKTLPTVPEHLGSQIDAIAFYTSYMRGTVSRDKFQRQLIKSKPSRELPMRFTTMLTTTAIFRALLYGRKTVDESDLALVRRIALDTVNQRDEEILRRVYILNSTNPEEAMKRKIQETSSYTDYTVEQVLQDFVMTGVLSIERANRRLLYRLSPDMAEIVKSARLYTDDSELNRESIVDELFEKDKPVKGRKKLKLRKVVRKE